MTHRVVLAEDNFLVREGVCGLLATSELVEVVGSCGDLAEAIDLIDRVVPDVVLTDIRMPPDRRDEGIRIAAHCRRRYPTMGVVLLSQYAEASYVRTLLAEGTQGRGYLLKERVADLDDLLEAIHAVAARWLRDRSQGHRDAGQRTVFGGGQRSGQAHAAGTGGARRHRAGSDERGDLGRAVPHPACRGEAHQRHLRQARAERGPDQPSPGQGHPDVSGRGSTVTSGDAPEGIRVMVVDDQPQFRRAAAFLIRATQGLLLVGEAGSGEEAVTMARSVTPDLVLMDVRLPGIDGPEATRQILAERPGIKVILLSTYEAADLPELGNCGAARFLRKQDLDSSALLD